MQLVQNSKTPLCSENIRLIAAGDFHTCAVSQTGQLRCFGSNSSGQCEHPKTLTEVIVARIDCSVAGCLQITCCLDACASQGGGCWRKFYYSLVTGRQDLLFWSFWARAVRLARTVTSAGVTGPGPTLHNAMPCLQRGRSCKARAARV